MIYNIYILLTVVLLYLYYKSDYTKIEYINLIFVGLWVIFSIEYYTTIDYKVYYENFQFPPKGLWEPIYEGLVTIFKPFGYVFFNACMAAFEIFTLCFMIKRLVPREWYWLAIILFVADPNTVFNFMTVKRQFISMAVTMWIPYVLLFQKERIRFLYAFILFLIAINIHTAAYMSILFFILPFVKTKPNRLVLILAGIVFVSCSGLLANNVQLLYKVLSLTGMAGRYENYLDIIETADLEDFSVGPVEATCRILSVSCMLWCIPKMTDIQYKITLISIFAYFLAAFLFADLWRLAWYFSMFNCIAIPITMRILWKEYPKYIAIAIISFILILPSRQYYLVMTGKSDAHQMFKMQHFYTIFDDAVDKSVYSQEEM